MSDEVLCPTPDQEDYAAAFVNKSSVAQDYHVTYEEALNYICYFDKYDKDRSGSISMRELDPILILMGMAPKNVAQQCKLQRRVQKLDDGDGCLSFGEFVALIKSFKQDSLDEMKMQLDIAIEVTKFTPKEVHKFEQIFMEFSHEREGHDEHSGFMTVTNVRQLVLLMGTRLDSEQTQSLDKLMRPLMITDLGNICAIEFPAFLVLLKEIVTQDFCGIVKRAEALVGTYKSEKKRMKPRSR